MTTVTAFRQVPDFAKGLVRDMRVRWALEEAGRGYEQRLIGFDDQHSPAHLALQPFGQVPVFQDEEVALFESGAIVLHIGEDCEALLPRERQQRARATAWVLAALNTVEVPVTELATIDLFHPDEEWARLRRPGVEQAVRARLDQLSRWLDGRDYLEGRFTAGDLLMTTVLRGLRHTDIVASYPNLDAYKKRCEARPAFQKALRDQLAAFERAGQPS